MIYFTSDTHFCHNKEFIYKPRGFSNIEEHDKAIIENWNKIINKDDIIYHLGDVMLNDNEKGLNYLKSLNGEIHIILGNHCTDTRIKLYQTCFNVIEVTYATIIKYKKCSFYLSHYPTITANDIDTSPYHKNLINIYGHTHQKTKFYNDNPYMYCVCLDAHNNYPVSIEQIIEDIKNKKQEKENNNEKVLYTN